MATEILRPNAAGDYTGIKAQEPSSGEHWDKVDEAAADDYTTYLSTDSFTQEKDAYNLQNTNIPSGATINSVKVYFRIVRTGSDPCYGQPFLRLGTNETAGTEIEHNGGFTTFSEVLSRPGGGSWAVSDLDDLQVAIGLRKVVAGWVLATQVYVEVDYTAGTGKTSADSGSGADAKESHPTADLSVTETGGGVEAVESLQTPQAKTSADVGSGTEGTPLASAILAASESGSGVGAVESLQTPQAKTSADSGTGVEGTPLSGAVLAASEGGSGIEALIARLLAGEESGNAVEASTLDTGGLENLFADESAEGADRLVAKIEMPVKGGGMRLWT